MQALGHAGAGQPRFPMVEEQLCAKPRVPQERLTDGSFDAWVRKQLFARTWVPGKLAEGVQKRSSGNLIKCKTTCVQSVREVYGCS